jgi:hypothetical protein
MFRCGLLLFFSLSSFFKRKPICAGPLPLVGSRHVRFKQKLKHDFLGYLQQERRPLIYAETDAGVNAS